jgi:hypothetical protein
MAKDSDAVLSPLAHVLHPPHYASFGVALHRGHVPVLDDGIATVERHRGAERHTCK